MNVIAGLGNPGAEYAKTKHNAGFMLIDALARDFGTDSWREKYNALVDEIFVGGEKIILVKPLTYMNNSGKAIAPILNFYKLTADDLIVAHDDMDIPVGTIRIRRKGSSGGHNGLKSIIENVGTSDFNRVRIGIGRPAQGWTVINHVLAPFNEEDVPKIAGAIDYLVPAVKCILSDGIDMAMNKYNPKKEKKKKVINKPSEEAKLEGED